MTETPFAATSRRRRLRFSLRSSLVAVAVFALILACVGKLHDAYDAEQQVAVEIQNEGGNINYRLFGWFDPDDPRRWERGPSWFQRVVFVRLSGTNIDDKRLSQLELERFKHVHSLSIGYDVVYGAGGPKWESLPAPITDEGLAELPPFPKLLSLNLWNVPVGDAGLKGLARKYPRLEHAFLQGTQVTDVSMAEIGQLQELNVLDLQETLITDSGLSHLAGLKNLQALRLGETRVVGPGLKHVAELPELLTLDLRDTGVSDEHARHLSRLLRLRGLDLRGTKIGDEGVRQLTSLQELTTLELRDTAVTDAGMKYLVQLQRLRKLSLTGTKVTDAGLAELSVLPDIGLLTLDGTGVTMIGVEDFLRRNPNCSVLYNDQVVTIKNLADES